MARVSSLFIGAHGTGPAAAIRAGIALLLCLAASQQARAQNGTAAGNPPAATPAETPAAAEPIEDLPARDGVIRLGARFKIRHEDGEEASYMLVSPAEADPRRGRISEESPIGRALLGRKKSEEVTADTPSGPERLKILDVG